MYETVSRYRYVGMIVIEGIDWCELSNWLYSSHIESGAESSGTELGHRSRSPSWWMPFNNMYCCDPSSCPLWPHHAPICSTLLSVWPQPYHQHYRTPYPYISASPYREIPLIPLQKQSAFLVPLKAYREDHTTSTQYSLGPAETGMYCDHLKFLHRHWRKWLWRCVFISKITLEWFGVENIWNLWSS